MGGNFDGWLSFCAEFVWSLKRVFVLVFFFFLINCTGVLGLHGGDGEKERERKKLERDINIFYCVNILF